MPKYRIETEGGTYEVETEGAKPGSAEWKAERTKQISDNSKKYGVADEGRSFLSGVVEAVNPIPGLKAMYEAGPVNTVKGIVAAQGEQFQKSGQALKDGRYSEAVGHGLAGALPLIGPATANAAEKIGEGKTAEGLGNAAGILAGVVAPGAIAKVKGVRVTPKVTNPNAAEASAMQYLKSEGVPVSAAAETGNPFVRGVQKLADTTPVGAYVAQKAEAQTAQAMRGAANRLMDRTHPAAVVPEQAGGNVRGALQGNVNKLASEAQSNYDVFHAVEADPANVRSIQVGVKDVPTGIMDASGKPITRQVPVTKDIPLATDVRGIKAELKPIYDHMSQWWAPARRNANDGYTAIKSILEGPDHVPASVAEAGLGGLKQMAREGDVKSAGLAKHIIPKLQKIIDDSVAQAGPDAIGALQQGRKLTAEQYSTQGVLKQLREEPVQAFGQLTWQKDAGIETLRQVAKEAPGELPKVGRAYLENLVGKATAEGGFNRAAGIFQEWQNLGPQTKQLLFKNPMLVDDLNKFFLGAKKLAENPNPSGSAVVGFIAGQSALAVTNPAVGIPYIIGAGALSKMLHTPRGVRLLTEGMKVPLGRKAAGASIASQILKLAGDSAKPMEPALAH